MTLAIAKNRYQQGYDENVFAGQRGKTLLDSIKAQVVARLINEGLLGKKRVSSIICLLFFIETIP